MLNFLAKFFSSIFSSGEFSLLTLHIHFRRRIEFYLIHNYIPAILVVAISWLSFFVDRECAPARVGMGITTILTMSTLLTGVDQQNLPVVSYVKALDWYYIGCFIFVFAALCEFSIVNYFGTKHRLISNKQRIKAASLNMKKAIISSLMGIIFMGNSEGECLTNCIIFQKEKDSQSLNVLDNYAFGFNFADPVFKTVHCVIDVPEIKDESCENSFTMPQISDKVENLIRVLYPVLFLIFNLIYWFTYRHTW